MVRVKRRYILAEIKTLSGKYPTSNEFIKEFKAQLQELYGDYGLACLERGLHIKRYQQSDKSLIISVRRGSHAMALSTIPMITSINSQACKVSVVHLSGTMRKCMKVLKVKNIMSLRQAIGLQLERERNAAKLRQQNPD